VDAYRAKKAEFARTPEQRETRRLYMQKWREANREKHNAYARQSHHKHKHKHIERNWNGHLKRLYGVTAADHAALLIKQNGRCAICGTDKPGAVAKRFHLDHCHETKKVRGLLCVACNTSLGVLEKWYPKHRAQVVVYLGRVP